MEDKYWTGNVRVFYHSVVTVRWEIIATTDRPSRVVCLSVATVLFRCTLSRCFVPGNKRSTARWKQVLPKITVMLMIFTTLYCCGVCSVRWLRTVRVGIFVA